MTNRILSPTEPCWRSYCERLARRIGDPEHSICDGKTLTHARMELEMPAWKNYGVEETLAYFERRGGYCDCEVLLNVNPEEQPALSSTPYLE